MLQNLLKKIQIFISKFKGKKVVSTFAHTELDSDWDQHNDNVSF